MAATLDKKKLNDIKKQRKSIIKKILIGHLLITPYIAYFPHQIMALLERINKGTQSDFELIFDWNYFKALNLLLIKHEPGMVLFWFLTEVLFCIILINLLLKPHPEIIDIREYPVTDYLSIPVPAGNGQYGKSWFATSQDRDRLTKMIEINSSDPESAEEKLQNESSGIVIHMERNKEKGQEIDTIYYLKDFSHTLILALTGAGKTRRILLQSIVLQIMAGECALISDVKGEIYYYTSNFARAHGYEVITIDLNNALKSTHYNFLQPIIDALETGRQKQKDKVERLKNQIRNMNGSSDENKLEKINGYVKQMELLKNDYSWTDKAQDYVWDIVAIFSGEQKGEPLWYNGETATLAACIMAVCLDAPKEYWNLYNVYNFIAYMAQEDPITHTTPLSIYLNQLPDTHPAKMIFMQSQIAAERTRSSFYTSALGTLRLFTKPSLAEMSSCTDFNLSSIGTKKTIIYMIIPDEKKTLYPVASVLINQLYIAQVETARKRGGSLPLQTNYDLDEIGNFPPIPVMSNMVSVGRSRRIKVNLVIQDYQQLEKTYKDDFETIKGQCGLKIFLKGDNNKTLEEISKSLGDYTTESPNASTSATTNLKTQDANISNGSNLCGRRLLKEEDISKIKSPDALVMRTGEAPMMNKLPDLSEYQFNKMLGLGDEEHNTKLIEQMENDRPEREYQQIPLWGIWNIYKEQLERAAMQET